MDIRLANNVIFFPSSNPAADVSFTARDKEGKAFYASTRIGDIKRTTAGYEVTIPASIVKNFEGTTYRFKEISSLDCLQEGKLLPADAPEEVPAAEAPEVKAADSKKKISKEA